MIINLIFACSSMFEGTQTTVTLNDTGNGNEVLDKENDEPHTDQGNTETDTGSTEWVCEPDPMAPTLNWQVDQPANHGLDPMKLQLAADYAEENHSECLVVVRDGYIVGEWYWNGLGPMERIKSWSVAKSYASTVVGLAVEHEFIDGVHDPIGKYVPELVATDKAHISIHDVLAMTSGVRFNLIEDNLLMAFSNDMTQRAFDNPVENFPGARWEYNNHTVQLSEPLIRYSTGMPAHEFAEAYLWEPIGMDARWELDAQGQAAMYMNVKATCRDHAKFAYLMLQDGCWDGEQVISREWIAQATTPASPHNRGYGYWWWLNGETPVLDSVDFSTHPTKLHPQAPDDAFCGAGLGSQMLEVIPSKNMVIVRFGPAPHENINFWVEQNGVLMDALENDGKQIVHNGVLSRVMDAIID